METATQLGLEPALSCHDCGMPETEITQASDGFWSCTRRPRNQQTETEQIWESHGAEDLTACWAELLGAQTPQQAHSSAASSFLPWVLLLLQLSEHKNRTTELMWKGWTLNIRHKEQRAPDAGEKGNSLIHTQIELSALQNR